MKAIIVAGGRGERLGEITKNIPKPMIDVAGKSILEHTLDLLKKYGINQVIMALCYLPEVITNYFGDGEKWGVEIKYTYEKIGNPQGTAGAIRGAKKEIGGDFIVTYADILRELNIREMIDSHLKSGAVATLNTYREYEEVPRSLLEIDDTNRLVKFVEQPKMVNKNGSFVWCNGSFYIFKPDIFDYIKKSGRVDFSKDIFPKLLADGEKVNTYKSAGYFLDIGTTEKLEKARKTFQVVG